MSLGNEFSISGGRVFDKKGHVVGHLEKGNKIVWHLQTTAAASGVKPDAVTVVEAPNGAKKMYAGDTNIDFVPITSTTIPTLGAIGDSIVETQYGNPDLGGLVGEIRRFTPHRAFANKACYMLDGLVVPDVYAFEGYSGRQAHQILAEALPASATMKYAVSDTVKAGIAARRPTITLDVSGTNDITFASRVDIVSGLALRRCIAARRGIWAYIRACGSEPLAMSLLPCQGTWSASDMTQNELKAYRPIWNKAIEEAAFADGVMWFDAYTPCVDETGGWKPNFIRHNGVDDPGGIHPYSLAAEAIAVAMKPVLANMIGRAPIVPRIELGSSAIYSAAFANDGLKQYFANFDSGLFPSLSGWTNRYNPQGAGTIALAGTTQDTLSGGNTCVFSITNNGSNISLPVGPQINVQAGQEYIFFCDLTLDQADPLSSLTIGVCEVTSGSASIWQPIASFDLTTGQEPSAIKADRRRVVGKYLVPAGVNKVAVQAQLNTNGSGGLTSSISISNIGQLRAK